MKRSEKEAVVQQTSDRLSRAKAVIMADYSGLKVEQMTELRQQLTAKGLDFVVVKNRLFKRALDEPGLEAMGDMLSGPNGFGFAYEEPVDLAKILVDFAKDNPKLEIKGGVLEGKPVEAAQVEALAKLPSRDALLAMLLGAMNGVARNFVNVLAANPCGLVTALQAIADQKDQEAA